MQRIHLDPEVYAALAAHKDHLSRARQREVSFGEALADLLDHFRSGPDPTMPDDTPAQPASDNATAAPDDGHRQPPP